MTYFSKKTPEYLSKKFLKHVPSRMKVLEHAVSSDINLIYQVNNEWFYLKNRKAFFRRNTWQPKAYLNLKVEDYWNVVFWLTDYCRGEEISFKIVNNLDRYARVDKVVIYFSSVKKIKFFLSSFSERFPQIQGRKGGISHAGFAAEYFPAYHHLNGVVFFGSDPQWLKVSWRIYCVLLSEWIRSQNWNNLTFGEQKNIKRSLNLSESSLGPRSLEGAGMKEKRFISNLWKKYISNCEDK